MSLTTPCQHHIFGARDEPEDVILGPRYVGIEDLDAEIDELMDVERLAERRSLTRIRRNEKATKIGSKAL